jgi:hypothetical protein
MTHFFGKGGVGGFLGRAFSLKNLVPEVLTVAGGAFGGPVGAGLGNAAGNLIEGRNIGQAALGGLEAGAGAYALGGLGSAGSSGGALSGTIAGNVLSDVSSGISGLGGDITSGLGAVGSDLGLTGAGSLGATLSSGVSSLGNTLGITGPGGLSSDISNTLGFGTGTTAAAGTATGAAAPVSANVFGSGYAGGGALPLTPTNVSGTAGGGGVLSNLFGGGATPAATELAGAGGAAARTAATAGGGGGLFSGGLLRTALAATPLALDLLRGNQQYKGENQLEQSAAQLSAQGSQLQNYLQTGTLPPGAQASINQAVAASQAAIRSQYASLGLSDSSAEAQDLAYAQTQGATQALNYAQSLLGTGISETNMSNALYQAIMNQSLQEDGQLSSAIGTFAAAAA